MACRPAGMETDSEDEFEQSYLDSGYSDAHPGTSSKNADDPMMQQNLDTGDTQENISQYTPNTRRKRIPPGKIKVESDDFHMAVMTSDIPTIKTMLDKDFAVDTILNGGWSGLMYASGNAQPEVVEYLLKRKANPNFNYDKYTPLMAACGSSNPNNDALLDCVRHLIRHGADINEFDRFHMTALMYASRDGRIEIVRLLIQHKVDIERQNNKGWTALAYAADRGHGPIVRLLLDNQANPSHVSHSGQTPADMAYSGGHKEIADILDKVKRQPNFSTEVLDGIKPKDEPMYDGAGDKNPDQNSNTKRTLCQDLEIVLKGMGHFELAPIFCKHAIDLPLMIRMSEKEFEKIGIEEFGARAKLLKFQKQANQADWQPSSIGAMETLKLITCIEAVNMMTNISRHIKCIDSSVAYLHDKIQADSRILELGQETQNVQNLYTATQDAMHSVHALSGQIAELQAQLNLIKDHVNLNSADVIKPQNLRRGSWTWPALFVTSAIVVGTIWIKPGILQRVIILT